MKIQIARLVGAVVLFLLALNAYFQTPIYDLWKIRIVSQEYGHWLALASALLIFIPRIQRRSLRDGISGLLLFIALGIFIRPLVQAAEIAKHLPSDLENEVWHLWGLTPKVPHLKLDWGRLWFGVRDSSHVIVERVEFKSKSGELLPFDYYRAENSQKNAPVVIVVHGGGWNSGDLEQLPPLNFHLAKLGYAVFAMSYRLAPQFKWPAPREDLSLLLKLLKEKQNEYGIDATKIVLLGRSAGAQIVGALAYGVHDPAVRGVIMLYGPADMNFAYDTTTEDDIIHSPKLIREFLGGKPNEVPEQYQDASPYQLLDRETISIPTLLIHGAKDDLVRVEQSRRFNKKLALKKVPHFYLELPWATHGFDYNLNGPGGQLATFCIEDFLIHVFNAPDPSKIGP